MLAHLVAGHEGRLLDGRRTPGRVVRLDLSTGEWLFMTFAETEAMSRRFHEAEAVLLTDHANRAF